MIDDRPFDSERLKSMKDSLGRYREMLEREKEETLHKQFRGFIKQLKLEEDTEVVSDLYQQFRRMIDLIEDDDIPRAERIAGAIESDFLYTVLALRSGAKPRELRLLTRHLSKFVADAARSSINDQMFVQKLIAGSLEQLAEAIDPDDSDDDLSAVEFWVDAVRTGLTTFGRRFGGY